MSLVEAAALGARLEAAGAGHLTVDRFLGSSAVASMFLGHEADGRAVIVKLVDSDLAYDVGGAEFVRAIGSVRQLAEPHVLPPGPDGSGGVCYVADYVAPSPLRAQLERTQPVPFTLAIRLATDTVHALAHWHALDLAHGGVGWDALFIQGDQVLLAPPARVISGRDAQRRDVQDVARVCLDLLEPAARQGIKDRSWNRLRSVLIRAAEGRAPSSLSVERLADLLTDLEYRVTRPAPGAPTGVRRLLAAIRSRFRMVAGSVG